MRAGLTVGGIEVELRAPAGPLEPILADRYGPFLGAVTNPVCSLQLEGTGTEKSEDNSPLADLTGADTTVVSLEHPDFTGTLDLDGDGTVQVAENPYTIDHVFRLLYGLLAARHDAVMLHSCGVISGATAHVFAGHSGAGKSTLASLAGHRPLLSDEHVIVRRANDEWIACSTPFWGSYAKPGPARGAPLARLYSLVQARTNEVRPTSTTDGVRTVLDNAVLACAEPSLKAAVFEVAVELAAAVPTAELRFAPDPEVWEVIDARVAVA